MISRAIDRLGLLLIVLQFCSMICSADEQQARDTEFARPDLVNCAIGNVTFQIDGPKLWTLSGIEYKTHSIATRDSAYGTVLNIEGVGLLGTAHFLDVPGQPGKVEKEHISQLQFFVDGSRVTPDLPQANLSGKSFRLTRSSVIRAVHLESEVFVENDVLIETVRMRTQEDVRLKLSYPLMYAWSQGMTDYLFGDDTGVLKRGSFLPEGAKPGESLWSRLFAASTSCFRRCLVSVHGCSGGLSQAASDEFLRENHARWFCWHLSVGDRILPGRAERLGRRRDRSFAGPERPRGHRSLKTQSGVTTGYLSGSIDSAMSRGVSICSGHLTSVQACRHSRIQAR